MRALQDRVPRMCRSRLARWYAGNGVGKVSRANQHPLEWRNTVPRRVGLIATALALWLAAVEARLIHLQVVRHDELLARAERQQTRTITVPPKRGDILDRRGAVLAYSVDADSIYAVPGKVQDKARTAAALCAVLDGCDPDERRLILTRLNSPRAFVYIRRKVSPEEAAHVAHLGLDGVFFVKESRRFYPNKELAGPLLGYVGMDNQGLAGIEAAYDQQVRGREGSILIQTDARQQAFSRLGRPATVGAALELTIDKYLQHMAERELKAAVAAHRADGGTIVVMQPASGEILALANFPGFNPNAFQAADEASRRNRAVQDLYEPGSTFKMVTASAAMDEGIMQPDDLIDVSEGLIRFGSRQIEDVHRYGVLTFADVIVKSSNVGAIKVGLKLGPERLSRYVRRFGFGSRISRDFPGENPGIVWDPARLSDSALASVAMGYQVAVTPLQMAAAISSVANGGDLVEPRVVRALHRGGVRTEIPRRVLRRSITPNTAERLTTIMEAVVREGTGRAASVDGFVVAGKTGTAEKLVNGRYSSREHNASFAGFVPSRAPVVTIVVVIDAPRVGGYFGGAVAAPVFRRVAELTLRHLGVPRTIDPPPVVLLAQETPAKTVVPARSVGVPAGPASHSVMPDLRGLSGREALRVLARLGVAATVDGLGLVVEQDPPPGVRLDQVGPCKLRLGRPGSAPSTASSQP